MAQIVVGVDGSDGSADALAWAVTEGGHRGWPVVAVMTWGYLDQHHPDGSTEFESGYTEADATQALDSFVVEALGDEVAGGVERRLVNDLPARGLIDVSRDAGLLVLGARGLGGFKGLLVGSVSQACLHHAACPVAIVRRTDAPPAGTNERIVVGVDGSPHSQSALDWALDEACARGARLDVVYAWSAPYLMGFSYGAEADHTVYEDVAREVLDDVLERADTHGLAEPLQKVLVARSPAHAVLEVADGADLVVVGSRGVGGLEGMLLGAVSYQVTHHASCSVVVVPTDR